MSTNAHLLNQQSRRDDLQSLGYMLIYLAKGSLPWMGMKESDKHLKLHKTRNMKLSYEYSTLCHALPQQFVTYF